MKSWERPKWSVNSVSFGGFITFGFCFSGNVGLLGVVLQRAEYGVVGQLYADVVEFPTQVADVPGHVMADDQLTIDEIPIDLIGIIDEALAAGQLPELIDADAVHLAGVAVDGLGGKVEVLAPDPAALDHQVGQLNDMARVHAVQLNVQGDVFVCLLLEEPLEQIHHSLPTPYRFAYVFKGSLHVEAGRGQVHAEPSPALFAEEQPFIQRHMGAVHQQAQHILVGQAKAVKSSHIR